MSATFRLSAFGDEIAADLAEQLRTLVGLNVRGLDLRGAWGKNVARMEDEDVARVKQVCAGYDVKVACLGSPVGKSPLAETIDFEKGNLTRLMAIGNMLDARFIRIFSFYPADTSTNAHYDQHVAELADRLGILAGLAEKEGFTLVLENEKGHRYRYARALPGCTASGELPGAALCLGFCQFHPGGRGETGRSRLGRLTAIHWLCSHQGCAPGERESGSGRRRRWAAARASGEAESDGLPGHAGPGAAFENRRTFQRVQWGRRNGNSRQSTA